MDARAVSLVLLASLSAGCTGRDTDSPPPAPPRCEAQPPVECALDVGERLPFATAGTTLGSEDGFGGASCGLGGDTIQDAAFRWTAPHADRYSISTIGSTFDTILSVRSGSCLGREIACNDDAQEGMAQSQVTIDLRECETITIVVDGRSIDAFGDFRLSIHGTEQSCMDGIDDDGDGAVDCEDDDCFGRECPGEDLWPVDWADLEWEVLELVNRERARGAVCGGEEMPPVGPLEMDSLVRLASRLHSEDMLDNGYFSHDSLDGRTLTDRMSDTGFDGAAPWGENIAREYRSPEEAVAGWMSSPGHCANIMSPSFRVTGIGYAENAGSTRWTQNFAASH